MLTVQLSFIKISPKYFGSAFDKRRVVGGGGRVAGGVPASVGAGALPRQCRCDSDVLTAPS